MSSEKVALTSVVGATLVAFAAGEVPVTLGGPGTGSVDPAVLPKNAKSSTGPGPDSFSPPQFNTRKSVRPFPL
jgi:hypothetical protein